MPYFMVTAGTKYKFYDMYLTNMNGNKNLFIAAASKLYFATDYLCEIVNHHLT